MSLETWRYGICWGEDPTRRGVVLQKNGPSWASWLRVRFPAGEIKCRTNQVIPLGPDNALTAEEREELSKEIELWRDVQSRLPRSPPRRPSRRRWRPSPSSTRPSASSPELPRRLSKRQNKTGFTGAFSPAPRFVQVKCCADDQDAGGFLVEVNVVVHLARVRRRRAVASSPA